MRIAFVTQEYVTESNYYGGLANYLHRVSLSLVRLGHRPVVIVLSGRDESFEQDGIEVHRVQLPQNRFVTSFNTMTHHRYGTALQLMRIGRRLCARLKELHAREPFSIVQFSQLGGPGAFRPRSVPCVVRLSSYTPLCVAHGDYDQFDSRAMRQQIRIEDRGLRRADGIFGPSRTVGAAVETDIGKPVEIIETPFVMDTEKTDDRLYRDLLRDKPYLLFVGRFSVAKGFITIADAIPDLFAKFPDLFFAFAGREYWGYRGSPAMSYMWGKAGKHRGRVLCLGVLPHAQLYPVMENALAVVAPSFMENFPNVCLEAMAHRRVVVGTRGAGFEQLLEDGVSGFLCERGNPAALVDAVGKAVRLSDTERAAMGEKAAERIHALRPELVVEQLLSYYRRVIDGKSRR